MYKNPERRSGICRGGVYEGCGHIPESRLGPKEYSGSETRR